MSATSPKTIRIGTRGSALALWQSRFVSDLIDRRLGRRCELVILKTSGDIHTGVSLAQLGKQLGEVGVFVKELERALLAREVDIAVHSLKDLPTDIPPGLAVACRPARVDVRDLLLVSAAKAVPGEPGGLPLRRGARVGTSSVRRRVLLLEQRPDLEMVTIRGNVPTRLELARSGQLDAVVLAGAGIDRLGLDLTGVVRVDLPAERFVPAPGQGALAIEARADDAELLAALATLDDAAAAASTDAERELLHGIGAGCSVPLGAHAVVTGSSRELLLRAALGPEHVAPGARPWIRRALVRAPDASAAARLGLQALGHLAPPRAADAPRRLAGKRVLVLREPARAAELVLALEAEGASVTARPATQERVVDGAGPSLKAALPGAAWVAFASASAVKHAAAQAEALRAKRLAALGAATAAALAEHDLPVDLVADEASGGGLAAALLAHVGSARPAVLLPCAQGGRPELRDALAAAGCAVASVELYASSPLPAPSEAELAVDAIVVAAPSAAKAALGRRTSALAARLVAIGETTAAALRELGLEATTSARPDALALVEAVVRALG